MAHEIGRTDNMMYVGEVPWHGIGTRLEGRPTSEEAIKASGLDWEVGLKPLFAGEYLPDATVDGEGPNEVPEVESPTNLRLVSHRATFRKTDGRILGVVGSTWKPLQNRDAFKFFDPFVEAGQAMYETAGSLRNGQRVWILAELAKDPLVIVPQADDVVKQYLLLSNGHDGTFAIRVGYTPVRVVCANTLSLAINDEASKLVKITHHGSANEALEKVRDVMNAVQKTFEATAQQYRELAAVGCDETTLKRYVNLVFAEKRVIDAAKRKNIEQFPTMDALIAELRSEVTEAEVAGELKSRIYPKVAELFEGGRGNALPGVRGTLWGAYNAINEYIVHERGEDAVKRFESAWFGQGAAQNKRALKVGLQLVKEAA